MAESVQELTKVASNGDQNGSSDQQLVEWLRRGLDLLEDSVLIADARGAVVFANRAARQRAMVDRTDGLSLMELAEALTRAQAGAPPMIRPLPNLGALSSREREVLEAFLDGFGTQTIADRLGLTPSTIRNHLKNASKKLGVRSQIELRELFARGRL